MVDHLEDRALHAAPVQGEDAQRDEPHVADARVGNEALDIRLRQGHVRAVDDRYRGDEQHGLQEEVHAMRKYRKRDPQETVRPHLEENPGQNYAARRGGFGVGVRQPRMHREHGHFDRESRQKGREQPSLLRRLKARPGQGQRLEVQRAAGAVYGDGPHQHQDASGQGEDQKLDCGVDAPRTSPDADEEKHGNEHELPENKEEKKIRCGKKPDHRRLRDQRLRSAFLNPR